MLAIWGLKRLERKPDREVEGFRYREFVAECLIRHRNNWTRAAAGQLIIDSVGLSVSRELIGLCVDRPARMSLGRRLGCA